MLQPKKEKKTVRFKRKKHLRNLERNKSGRNATVKMATYTGTTKTGARDGFMGSRKVTKHYAAPTITFKGKEKAKKQNFKEALVAGEVYEFTSKRKAKNFACGSWKKGKSKLTRKQLRDCRKKNKS
tara:strand:- start:3283 stop:3660 length:378 start_codon:yes stop_codon:yes gene_type:complete